MSVLIEAISVVVRTEEIRGRYAGGWEQFVADCPNQTLCADGGLARVGFMTPADLRPYLETLAARGLRRPRGGRAQDFVVVDQERGFAQACDWADLGELEWPGSNGKVVACRLAGDESTELVTPPDWQFEGSLSQRHIAVDAARASEFLDFVRHEGGIDVYRDLRTGREIYVGRVGGTG
jgi:hypothetical protein